MTRVAALVLCACALATAAAPGRPQQTRLGHLPAIPDSAGIPTRLLASVHAPNGDTWYGTYGRGIFVRAVRATSRPTASSSGETPW